MRRIMDQDAFRELMHKRTDRITHLLKRAFHDYKNFSVRDDDDGNKPLLTITIAAEADYEQQRFLRGTTTEHGLILTIHLRAHLPTCKARIESYTLNSDVEQRVKPILQGLAHKHNELTYSS